MVGRKVLLEIDKGAGASGQGRARGRATSSCATTAACVRVDDVSFASARRRDRRHRRRRRQRPVRAARGARRHPAARAGGEILVDGEPLPPAEHDPHAERGHRPRPRARRIASASASSCRSRRARAPSSATRTSRPTATGLLYDRRRSSPTRDRKMEAFDVRPRAPLLKTANFSGGNQQKLVLAREIERNPKVLLVGQPTRGVDIGAIEFIHQRIVDHARRRQGDPAGLGRARRDLRARRPHPRDVRRPHHRRAPARARPTRRTSAC